MLKSIALALSLATAINVVAIGAHAQEAQDVNDATETAAPVKAKRAASPAFLAGRAKSTERMRQCAVEWKTAKADEAVKTAGWPHYWSACNARIKSAASQ